MAVLNSVEFLVSFVVGAFLFAYASAWVFRRDPVGKITLRRIHGVPRSAVFSDIETAYLLGGASRAKEVALVRLLIDGLIKTDGRKGFVARFSDAPDSVPPVDRELLSLIAPKGGIGVHDLENFHLATLARTEARLVRKGLLIEEGVARIANVVSRFPLLIAFCYSMWLLGLAVIQNNDWIVEAACLSASLISYASLTSRLSPRTSSGEEFVKAIRKNLKETMERHRAEERASGADRLSDMQSRVLLYGLNSLVGMAIVPTESREVSLSQQTAT